MNPLDFANHARLVRGSSNSFVDRAPSLRSSDAVRGNAKRGLNGFDLVDDAHSRGAFLIACPSANRGYPRSIGKNIATCLGATGTEYEALEALHWTDLRGTLSRGSQVPSY